MDWASREVLAWNFSSSLDRDFCLKALEQAFSTGRRAKTFNTDQGSQYTSKDWLKALRDEKIEISMDGSGRWRDNVRMERLWRSYQYEHYYLHGHETLKEIRETGEKWMNYYNRKRPHSKLDMLSPMQWREQMLHPDELPEERNFFEQDCTTLRFVTSSSKKQLHSNNNTIQ